MALTAAQRNTISQFVTITGAQERVASTFCKKYAWRLDKACDAYFASLLNPNPAAERLETNLTKLCEKYRDVKHDAKDTIGIEGTMAYLLDLGVNLEDASSFVPLEIVQAPALGEMKKTDFVKGWKAVAEKSPVDTIPKQRSYIAAQVIALSTDSALFKRVYRHTFICSKDKGQMSLPLENAIIYWKLLFSSPGMKWASASTDWLDIWIDFVTQKWKKNVTRDMWNQAYEFYHKSMQDEAMSFWDENGAWPIVIDDFVKYVKERRGVDRMDTD